MGQKIGSSLKGGEILALVGDLGAGKTTFIQGLGESLGVQKIISPTFIILRKYPIKLYKNMKINTLYHLDLYRLEGAVESELINLGIKDILKDEKAVVVVEWADKATGIFPKGTIWINFEALDDDKRKITLK